MMRGRVTVKRSHNDGRRVLTGGVMGSRRIPTNIVRALREYRDAVIFPADKQREAKAKEHLYEVLRRTIWYRLLEESFYDEQWRDDV